jgi:hypothetical protein
MKTYHDGVNDCLLILRNELKDAKEELNLANKGSDKNIDFLKEDVKVIKFLINKIEQIRK